MTDSTRRTPPLGMKKPPRMQSQDERDAEGYAARRERDVAAAVKEREDEITGRHAGEELAALRALRPNDERIGRLELKHDELKADVHLKHQELKGEFKEVRDDVKKLSSTVASATGKIEGQSSVLSETLGIVRKIAEQKVENEHISLTAKVEVDKAHELAKVEVAKEQQLAAIEVNKEVNKEQQLAAIEVSKEEKVDLVKAKHDRRKRNIEILALVASGMGVVELAHRLWEWIF